MPQQPPRPFLEFFKDALSDNTLLILMAAAVLSILLSVFFSDDPTYVFVSYHPLTETVMVGLKALLS